MKLAIVTPYPPSKITLNEYAYYLVNHFNDNKDIEEIILIVDKLNNEEEYVLENRLTKVKIYPAWSFNSLKNPYCIYKALKKHAPDFVMYNIQFLSFGDKKIPATLGLLSPAISRLSGIPSLVLLHNIIETVDLEQAGITKNKILGKVYNFVGSMLTRIILQSNMLALTIPKYVDIIKDKYKTDNVIHMPHGTFEALEEPSYSHGNVKSKKIMTFGKFGTYKKVEMMIDAVEIVRNRIQEPIEIVIAGTDNPNVKGYLDNVKRKYNHVKNLHFTGYVPECEVPNIFKNCTSVVFPYTSTTGSSGVLHQAGNYGKSVVIPKLGDLKELIEDEGYAGSYFEPNNLESLADAIEKVLVDDNFRVEIEKQNFQAASSFSMTTLVEKYVHLFKNMKKDKTAYIINRNALNRTVKV